MKEKSKKLFEYVDELNDDFAETGLERPEVDENYKFIRKNKINNFFSAILYYGIVKPAISIYAFFFGVRVKGRKKLKEFRKKALFIYANHTSYFDAVIIQSTVVRLKRTNILGYSDASTIPVAKHICRACGYLPIPTNVKGMAKLMEAIKFYISKNQNILIYPEAHIWPKYTKIRPFLKTSFHYPAKLKVPVLPMVSVWRKSKLSSHAKMTIVIGDPIYPRLDFNDAENKTYLRDQCYEQMCKISSSYDQYEEYIYRRKTDEKNINDKKL